MLKPAFGFLVESQNQYGGEFFDLSLKTDRSDLVIWGSKSSRWFLSLDLKIKCATICRLRHKIDGVRLAQNTRRRLAQSTTCKIWFSSCSSSFVSQRFHRALIWF
jgi:hypothetical protein